MTGVDRTSLPVPGPEPAFTPPRPVRTTFDNGLAVWSLERGSVPLASVVLTLQAGAWADPADRPGLSSFTADMLDEGIAGHSALDIQAALARLGAELETEASHDALTLTLTVLERHLDAGLALLAELVCRPSLTTDDIDRVRELRLNRLRQLRDLPAALAERALAETLYGAHPYAHLPYGSSASLRTQTDDDVRQFHRAVYRPDGATIIVAGPLAADDVERRVTRQFAGWRAGDADVVPRTPSATTDLPSVLPRVVLVHRPDAPQTELRIGQVAVPRLTPDFHALLTLNNVLGGSFVSRLNLTLRERKGYTYGVHSAFEFRKRPGPFTIATSVQTDATADAVAECLAEVGRLRGDAPITLDELQLAQNTLTRGYARGFEAPGQLARALAQLALHGLPDDTFAIFSPRVRAQTVASITDAAQRHLDPDRLVVVAVGDVDRIGGPLRELGETIALNPEL